MKVRKAIHAAADILAAALLAAGGLAAEAIKGAVATQGRRSHKGFKLLTLEADYSLATIKDMGLEQIITSRDLGGFFEHVWTVNPLVGAAPDDRAGTAPGPPSVMPINRRHTMIEGKVEWSGRLAPWPTINFVLAQRRLLTDLAHLVRVHEISVIRASDPYYLGLLGLFLARVNRLPLVMHLIANYDGTAFVDSPAYPRLFRRRSVEKRIERFLLPRSDLVAAGTQDILRYALHNGADAERSTVFLVGNLIDLRHFRWDPAERPCVRTDLGLADGDPFVICVGRLEPFKHPDDVVRVISDDRLRQLGVKAVFVGEGTMRSRLESMAAEAGLNGQLIFVGKRDQEWLARALASATVVLSPLTGRALIEATLSGTVAVAYDTDWQSELVLHGETGLLAPYRDTEKMADAVFELVSRPAYAAVLGAAGRARTLDVMDPELLLERERSAYSSLLSGHSTAGCDGRRAEPVGSGDG